MFTKMLKRLFLSSTIDMLLFCPECDAQHIDKPDASINWQNAPHRSHLCHACGHIWRPCDAPTNGVSKLLTAGSYDLSPYPKRVRGSRMQPVAVGIIKAHRTANAP